MSIIAALAELMCQVKASDTEGTMTVARSFGLAVLIFACTVAVGILVMTFPHLLDLLASRRWF
jgi:hypothetical protein